MLPELARACAEQIVSQIEELQTKIDVIERTIKARHRADEVSRRLANGLVVDFAAFEAAQHTDFQPHEAARATTRNGLGS